ncbi:MAG: CPBP family intramembrane glutamic endopeptidase [Bacteroidia bacterium]|jgi:membrane protease YdiL (CAAX protease family)
MNKIIESQLVCIKALNKEGFRGFGFLATILTFLTLSVAYRYYLNPAVYSTLSHNNGLLGFLFYSVAYFFVLIAVVVFFKKWAALSKIEFWIVSLFVLLVLYVNQFCPVYSSLFKEYCHYDFTHKLGYNLQCVFTYSLPPLIFWWGYHRKLHPEWNAYGWHFSVKGISPYIVMFMLMTPLLVWAAFRPDFQLAYPRYSPGIFEAFLNVPPILTVSAFEISYTLQFIALEWFFRGFIVMALSRFLGQHAVWVMVFVYVFLHFGKPMHETIGSFFGGLILGNAALHTKSIWGGIVVHVGIALLMELFAYLI